MKKKNMEKNGGSRLIPHPNTLACVRLSLTSIDDDDTRGCEE